MEKSKKSNFFSIQDACCWQMFRFSNDPESPFNHIKSVRAFYLNAMPEGYLNNKNQVDISYAIEHCIFCGTKFPPDLYDYRAKILKEDFGLKMRLENYEINPAVPKEFLTDQWWISRQKDPDFPTKNKTRFECDQEEILDDQDLTTEEKQEKLKKLIKNNAEYENKILATKLGIFCCYSFKISIETVCDRCPGNTCSEYPIIYEAEKRRYRLTNIPPRYLRDGYCRRHPRRELFVNIFYCPRCGQKLKESLASRWYKEIHEKFGVYDILSKSQMAKVPQKYLTDEWWKELGL